VPFLVLGLELPPAPLFRDATEKAIIPQVPIYQLLAKFGGERVTDDIRAGRRRFRVTRLPRYLALHFKRFAKNNFFVEKNPTLVTFPVKGLDLRDASAAPLPPGPSKYDLVAQVVHEGAAGQQNAPAAYKAHVHRKVEGQWYEVQDLVVTDILPQMVALSEAYFQVYALNAGGGGTGGGGTGGGGTGGGGGGNGGSSAAAAAAAAASGGGGGTAAAAGS
jgi:U4/U6.U5 tri-snRNP-associated protein 2